jgi:hypothetical protein
MFRHWYWLMCTFVVEYHVGDTHTRRVAGHLAGIFVRLMPSATPHTMPMKQTMA